ncbi:hypothetical protein [Clostera anachoreta granulovirus]|uniref:Uncharacterized protein n=1 Tax=Clostera anachoreta granulovirus TaxID=283675 RepID=F4ZKS8_9BBAC|nr:hypothetical protein ClanGV_gp051 [Clostera anachoreta granulovirus]AEB00339.1 hypothetical protein [Clostera anachoreta granulovirus]
MGNYKSHVYILEDLERHECDKCVFTKQTSFCDQFYVGWKDCPFRIYCNKKKTPTAERIEYVQQLCVETEESKNCTFITIEPFLECLLMPEMLGKIFFTKTPQTCIVGNVRTMHELMNGPEHFANNVSVECSYICDFKTLKQIDKLKPLFDKFPDVSTKNLVYVDNTGATSWNCDVATNLNVRRTIKLKEDHSENTIKFISRRHGELLKIVAGDDKVYHRLSDTPFVKNQDDEKFKEDVEIMDDLLELKNVMNRLKNKNVL